MKIISVVGARPQFVKLAPIAHESQASGVDHVIIHTGQHYDRMLSDVFFRDLRIPSPDIHLGVGSASHGKQTAAMLEALEKVLPLHRPDWVLVYGDTNSTLAASLAAVKLHLPLAHLEAGLRSFNRRMPEEHNRVLTDHAADLLLAPTHNAMDLLASEGLGERSVLVGDVMTDVLFTIREQVKNAPLSNEFQLPLDQSYYLATLHRAENTDDPARLRAILDSLAALPHSVILLAHPRLVTRARESGIELQQGAVLAHPPLPYPDLVRVALGARGIVTDSGGLQKEAFLLRVPCTTVRSETEWPETVDLGWNVLAAPDTLAAAVLRPSPPATEAKPYGDGNAAARVIAALAQRSLSA